MMSLAWYGADGQTPNYKSAKQLIQAYSDARKGIAWVTVRFRCRAFFARVLWNEGLQVVVVRNQCPAKHPRLRYLIPL